MENSIQNPSAQDTPTFNHFYDFIGATYLANHQLWVLQSWISDLDIFERAFKCAIERGLEVKVAILNPSSSYLRFRSEDIGISPLEVTNNIWQTLVRLEKIAMEENYIDDFEVRLYDSNPTLGLYRLDNKINLELHWKRKNIPKDNSVILETSNSQHALFSQQVISLFEQVWNDADSINFRDKDWKKSL